MKPKSDELSARIKLSLTEIHKTMGKKNMSLSDFYSQKDVKDTRAVNPISHSSNFISS